MEANYNFIHSISKMVKELNLNLREVRGFVANFKRVSVPPLKFKKVHNCSSGLKLYY